MYAGVPHCSLINSPLFIILLTPKSAIFTFPFPSSRILSNLISRCKTQQEWIWPIPSIIYYQLKTALITCLKIYLAIGSFSFLLFLTQLSRSPPAHISITQRTCLSVSKVSNSLTTFGCLNFLRIVTSLRIFLFELSSFKICLFIDLIATSFLENFCIPRLTLPKAPFPKTFPILQNSKAVLGASF